MSKKLRQNNQGIVLAGIIAITFIVLSSMIWVVGAIIVSRFNDGFLPFMTSLGDPRVTTVASMAMTAYGWAIVPVDVGLIVWWALSASKKESQEYNDIPVGANF